MSAEWKKEVGICDFEYLYLPLLKFSTEKTQKNATYLLIFFKEIKWLYIIVTSIIVPKHTSEESNWCAKINLPLVTG